MNNISINIFNILTIGGVALWEEDKCDVINILTENDIVLCKKPYHSKGTYFCKVDTLKTNMNDFYKWEEISDEETFCWRTFYVFGEKDKYMSWLPIPNEKIGKYNIQELFDAMYKVCKS